MIKNHSKMKEISKPKEQYAQNSLRQGKFGNRRLSKQLLHDLRNLIPIQHLIEKELGIQHHMDGKYFRFKCPKCSSFHTSVMKTINLAKCFDCQNRFNPIDMVMAVRKTEFIQSADYLINLLETVPLNKPVIHKSGNIGDIQSFVRRNTSGDPVPITSVIRSMQQLKVPNTFPDEKLTEQRVQNLEKEIEKLKKRIEQIYKFIEDEFVKQSRRTS